MVKYDTYPDDDITVNEGTTIYFRERFANNTYGKVNTLKIQGGNLYRDDKNISNIVTGTTGTTTPNTGTTIPNSGTITGTTTGTTAPNTGTTTTDTPIMIEDKLLTTLDTSTGVVDTNLLATLNNIKDLENTIELLQTKISNNVNSVELQTLNTELSQLTGSLSTLKQNVTTYYNGLDNNSKVLLEPATTTTQKQQALNSISTGVVYTGVSIPSKTYETLPNQSQTASSVALLQTKATELRNEVETLRTTRDAKYAIYNLYYQDYLTSQREYNNYLTDRANYANVLQRYNAILTPINNLGVLPNINLNVGYIISNYSSVQTAINEVNTRFSQYSLPSSTNYALDTTTKGRISTADTVIVNMLGVTSSVKITYGSTLSFPATIETKYNGVSLGSLTLKNNQHAIDVINYYKRYSEKTIVIGELNKLLPIETEKKNLAAKVLDNVGNYILISALGVDYYKIYEDAYLLSQTAYITSNGNLQTKVNLLASYENQLKSYGVNLDNLNLTEVQLNQKTNAVATIEENNTNDISYTGGLYINIEALKLSLANSKVDTVAKHTVNELNYYVNGGSETSLEFQKYPFISYARYNISGTNKDYPAQIWVDYKIPGEDIYPKLGGGYVNNEAEKNLVFANLHRKAKQLIDNNNSYLNELCFKYANEKYPLTGVGSTSNNGVLQSNYIKECLKNPALMEDYLINDTIKETILDLGEFGLEISGLQSIGKSWGSLIAYWTGYITNDPYLTAVAKANLNNDLIAVSQEVNVLGKIKKLNKFTTKLFDERVGKRLLTIKWSTVNKPDLSKIENQGLKNRIVQNYRDGSKIGNGSTADAIRYTKVTGLLVENSDHLKKGTDELNAFNNLLTKEKLSDSDLKVAYSIIEDIQKAQNGK